MGETEARLSTRITTVEDVVRHNSAELGAVRHEVAELRARFDQRDLHD